jgi:HPt (histidine-containing phosphotransfer) domain-containing protein
MPGISHLDQAATQELRNIMGSDFGLLVQTFVRDSAQRIEAIRSGIKTGDADMLRRAAHSFKGSAANMGAPRLADICRSLEELGRIGDTSSAHPLVDELVIEYGAVERELTALLR